MSQRVADGSDWVALVIVFALMASVVGLLIWVAQDERARRDAGRADMEARTQELQAHSEELEARLREAGVQIDPLVQED